MAKNNIRVATEADGEAIRRVVNTAFAVERFFKVGGGDRLQDDRELEGMMERGTFLLMEDAGEVMGCVYLEPRGELCYLGLLSIDPSMQGQGLAKQMSLAAEAFARSQGCRAMELTVVSLRTELPPIYRKLGYAEDGRSEYPEALAAKMSLPGYFIHMTKPL